MEQSYRVDQFPEAMVEIFEGMEVFPEYIYENMRGSVQFREHQGPGPLGSSVASRGSLHLQFTVISGDTLYEGRQQVNKKVEIQIPYVVEVAVQRPAKRSVNTRRLAQRIAHQVAQTILERKIKGPPGLSSQMIQRTRVDIVGDNDSDAFYIARVEAVALVRWRP